MIVKKFFYVVIAMCCGLLLVILRSTANLSKRDSKAGTRNILTPYPSGFLKEDSIIMKTPLQRSEERVDNLKQQCQKYNFPHYSLSKIDPKMFHHILVDDKYKVLYCQIPKVACTNWRRVFLMMTGKMNTTNLMKLEADDVHHKFDKHISYLRNYSPTEIRKRLKHYFKFIIVREPMERLLSAYRNKFMSKYGAYFKSKYGKMIIKKYRDNPSFDSLESGEGVTFLEFVRYLVDPVSEKRHLLNEHWMQYYKLCHPCLIDYDFISNYETLTEDSKYILHNLEVDDVIQFPKRSSAYTHSETSTVLENYYRSIPQSYMEQLTKMYYPDYKLFSFTIPDFLSKTTFNASIYS